ncbi:HNH endonuclease family protein (plasmid) [Entomospira entomophila]|uniref:HNH endonuclease n=1 Tax=Entomospira entomophila TaxID=2719988 RepID=A0A968GF23_9SPIO|nr:HNH endonuclease family protein [Entomospira entomophilus]NIZ41269.1 HNH endonuclease [Entomospira entomophilus]WDI36203.1 HNH endonuclease family protein [Entomospira entomophilus]
MSLEKDIFPLNLLHHDHVNASLIAKYCQSLSGWVSYWVLLKKPTLIQSNHFKHIQLEEHSWRYLEALTRLTRDANLLALLAVSIWESQDGLSSIKRDFYDFLVQMERWIFVQKSFVSGDIKFDWAMRYAYRLHQYSQYPVSYREGWKEHAFIAMKEQKHAETEQYLHQNSPKTLIETIDGLCKRTKGNYGFYGWKVISYFLYEYERHLSRNIGMATPLLWQEVEESSIDTEEEKVSASSKKESIEHILPQTSKGTDWESQLAIYSEEEIQNITHSLGNLALMKKNSEAKNNSYQAKVKIYQQDTLSVQEVARLYPDGWSVATIKTRGESLLDFMEERWELKDLRTEAESFLHLPQRE